jgi:MSHA biogenesis protein MshK
LACALEQCRIKYRPACHEYLARKSIKTNGLHLKLRQSLVEYIKMKPAKYLTTLTSQLKLLVMVIFGMLILFTMRNVQAENLKDPTQPPASLSGDITSTNANVTAPVLQSVMISTQFSAAIINGQKVMLGKKYEQATLIKVNENEAVLRNADMTTQILKMDYAGMKKNVSPIKTTKVKSNKPSKKNKTNNE